jgi:hypothetical protein
LSVAKAARFCLICIALIALIALGLLIFDQRLFILKALLAALLPASIAAAPVVFVYRRMKRGPDTMGLAVAVAFPLIVYGALVLGAHRMSTGSTEDQMDLFARIVFFFADPMLFVFVLGVLPSLGAMLVGAIRAARSGTTGEPAFQAAVPIALIALIAGYVFIWLPITGTPSLDPQGLEYLNIQRMAG